MNGLNKSDFNFELPEELIAQTPIEDRSSSRLLVLDKKTGEIHHRIFRDIVTMVNPGVNPGDCLVINDTKVIPARLLGARKNTGGVVEVLLLKKIDRTRWEVLVKPGRRAKPGCVVEFGGGKLIGLIEEITECGNRIIRFDFTGIFEEILNELGEMPLPPYITQKQQDPERYQTVYAKNEGSVAAPTAGLHFTDTVLKDLKDKGVNIARVTLHVGLGTFRPVKTENILEHKMHSEFYQISSENADIINKTKKNGGRIIAVGTTSCRVLETCSDSDGFIYASSGWTDIFIYPGYRFKIIDGLLTNFHIPESTLIMLVSALCGRENVLRAYKEAVDRRYRFFSFGDACLIL